MSTSNIADRKDMDIGSICEAISELRNKIFILENDRDVQTNTLNNIESGVLELFEKVTQIAFTIKDFKEQQNIRIPDVSKTSTLVNNEEMLKKELEINIQNTNSCYLQQPSPNEASIDEFILNNNSDQPDQDIQVKVEVCETKFRVYLEKLITDILDEIEKKSVPKLTKKPDKKSITSSHSTTKKNSSNSLKSTNGNIVHLTHISGHNRCSTCSLKKKEYEYNQLGFTQSLDKKINKKRDVTPEKKMYDRKTIIGKKKLKKDTKGINTEIIKPSIIKKHRTTINKHIKLDKRNNKFVQCNHSNSDGSLSLFYVFPTNEKNINTYVSGSSDYVKLYNRDQIRENICHNIRSNIDHKNKNILSEIAYQPLKDMRDINNNNNNSKTIRSMDETECLFPEWLVVSEQDPKDENEYTKPIYPKNKQPSVNGNRCSNSPAFHIKRDSNEVKDSIDVLAMHLLKS